MKLNSTETEKMVKEEKRSDTLYYPPLLLSSKASPFDLGKIDPGVALSFPVSPGGILHCSVVLQCSRGLGGGKILKCEPGR